MINKNHSGTKRVNSLALLVLCIALIFIMIPISKLEKERIISSENDELINVVDTSDIPVDEDFEAYSAGSQINGQGNWYSMETFTCSATILDRGGDKWLNLYDDNTPNNGIVQAGMELNDSVAPRVGFVKFKFETTKSNQETFILLSDGPWLASGLSIYPNGSATIRIDNNQFYVNNSGSWDGVQACIANTEYDIEIHYKISVGWHISINGTTYGADYSYGFAFGQPAVMNLFEVSTSLTSRNYNSYFDDIDLSWTPNDFPPTLENGSINTTFGTNETTTFKYSVNYTDADNNPPK
ncbi:MAG: hypothetical protein ACTSWN_05180, partial [Promethearchaeota archaeon]